MSKQVLTEILTGEMSPDVMEDITLADEWMNNSIDQLECGEEPTLVELIYNDRSAIISYRATMAAIFSVMKSEQDEGHSLFEATRKIEPLVFRLAAALSHKAAVSSRAPSALYEGLA